MERSPGDGLCPAGGTPPGGRFRIIPEKPVADALKRVGHRNGVPLLAETQTVRPPESYDVPVGPECEVQPYIKAHVVD